MFLIWASTRPLVWPLLGNPVTCSIMFVSQNLRKSPSVIPFSLSCLTVCGIPNVATCSRNFSRISLDVLVRSGFIVTKLEAKSTKMIIWLWPLSGGKSGAMSIPTVDLGFEDVVVICSLWFFVVVYMFSWHGRHCLICWDTRDSMDGKWYLSRRDRKTCLLYTSPSPRD